MGTFAVKRPSSSRPKGITRRQRYLCRILGVQVSVLSRPTNAVELLQVERVYSEGEGYEVPRVHLTVKLRVQEVVDVGAEVLEHGYHIREEVVAHRDLPREMGR